MKALGEDLGFPWTRRGARCRSGPGRRCCTGRTTRCTCGTRTGTAGSARTRRVRGRDPVRPAPARRDRVGVEPGALRGLHARGAVPGLQGRPAQAGVAGGAGRRPVDRRGVQPADPGGGGLPRRARAHPPRAADRRARAQGDPRAARLPARRRPGVPLAGPRRGHAVRRRGAADPAGDADRLGAGRRPLRARRAEHRAAPAGQPPADRDPHPAARPRATPSSSSSTTRTRSAPSDWAVDIGPRRGRARRPGRLLRHRRRACSSIRTR